MGVYLEASGKSRRFADRARVLQRQPFLYALSMVVMTTPFKFPQLFSFLVFLLNVTVTTPPLDSWHI